MAQNNKDDRKRRRLAEGDDGGGEGGGAGDETTMDVADIKALLSDIFGVTLPDDVDTAKELKIALEAMHAATTGEPSEGDQADAIDDAAGAAMDAVAPEAMSLNLARRAVGDYRKRLSKLQSDVKAIRTSQLDQAKAAFDTELDGLLAAGKVQPAHKAALMTAGKAAGYQLSLLAPYRDLPAVVPTERKVKLAALGGGGSADGDDKAKAIKARQEQIRLSFGTAKATEAGAKQT